MNEPVSNNKHRKTGVFKQWSRKGYAIFGSLGNVVHIGRLSVALLQCIGQLVFHIETELELALKSFEEEDNNESQLADVELLTLEVQSDARVGAYISKHDISNRR
jgi:hypothetical protein